MTETGLRMKNLKHNFRQQFKSSITHYYFSAIKAWWTTSFSKFLDRNKHFILQVMLKIWISTLPESEKGNGKQEEEIKCRTEIQYLFNTCIFTKMMVKLNPTSWLTESLVGVCYRVFKTCLHTHTHTPHLSIYSSKHNRSSQVCHRKLKV